MPIHLRSDDLTVTVLPRGATITAVRFGSDGPNMVLGYANYADHFAIPGCAGAIVGPVANRISGARIEIDGETWQMPRNDGKNALHSGPSGLHMLPWDVTAQSESDVSLAIRLNDGDHGLPGERDIAVTYRVAKNSLWVEISARTDRPTPMNLATHGYWRLDAAEDISSHSLQIAAQTYLPTDSQNLPTGKIAEVAGTAFDFTQSRPVPLGAALDVNFCLGHDAGPEPRPCAVLRGADGTTLELATTAPGLQVYDGAHLPRISGILDGGDDLAPYRAIALEPQLWPDAPRHTHFPNILLRPGHMWRQISRFTLSRPAT